ncbi:CPBP family intramembrane metalloprotease, partial [Klebsiella pneumoniae]|nr:CPBP family intramembrane metalloprotease [Klebsiella pneumoniae]
LFKKIYPGQSVIQFVKDKFRAKLKLSVILTASMIQAFIFLLILFLISKNSEVDSIFTVSSWGILIYFFVKNFLAGP